MHEVLGQKPWSAERAILNAAVDEPLIGIRGGKGWGKTKTFSWLYWWNIDCWENTVCITTATTWTQVAGQLWREIREAYMHSRKKLPGRLLDTRHDIGEKWFGLGISTKKPESLAGFHASLRIAEKFRDNPEQWANLSDDEFFNAALEEIAVAKDAPRVVVLADEASGIEEKLWPALDGLLTNPFSRMVIGGNPTQLAGRHYEIFHDEVGGDG